MRITLFALFIALLAISSCKSPQNHMQSNNAKVTGPKVVIYKTRDNYFLHVPVSLSKNKRNVTSFPAPGDLKTNGELAMPLKLENGYLLDRRGINENCAFLKLTYYEYNRLAQTPSAEELMELVLDADPITEMYYAGRMSDYKDPVNELNELILKGDLTHFTKVK